MPTMEQDPGLVAPSKSPNYIAVGENLLPKRRASYTEPKDILKSPTSNLPLSFGSAIFH